MSSGNIKKSDLRAKNLKRASSPGKVSHELQSLDRKVIQVDYDPSDQSGIGLNAPINSLALVTSSFGTPYMFQKYGTGAYDWRRNLGIGKIEETFFIRDIDASFLLPVPARPLLPMVPFFESKAIEADSAPMTMTFDWKIQGIQTGFTATGTPEGAIGDSFFFHFRVHASFIDSTTIGGSPIMSFSDIDFVSKIYLDAGGGLGVTNDSEMDVVLQGPLSFGPDSRYDAFRVRAANGTDNGGGDSGRVFRWWIRRDVITNRNATIGGETDNILL